MKADERSDTSPSASFPHVEAIRPPVVVLVGPQLGENIGQAARAMANFGLTELRLVAPRDGWPNEKAAASAASAFELVDNAVVYPTLSAAIADLHFIGATTARVREMVKPVLSPESAAQSFAARAQEGQRCGILFGRERSGLENDELSLADVLVMAPVDPAFASLNLAQAVLLIGYEWRKYTAGTLLGRGTQYEAQAVEGLSLNKAIPATKNELMGFFTHKEEELSQTGFALTGLRRFRHRVK
ncbi:MAG: RNA methyltransferase [Alphaproteobacteria bacterium]